MIFPNDVADAIKSKLVTNKETVGIKDALVLSEDSDSKELRPPYAGVVMDFDDDSEQETPDSTQIGVPVEMKILCSSSENKTASISFREAFLIANQVISLLKGALTVGSNEIALMLRRRPISIIRNSAEQCVLQVNLYYTIDAVGE